MADSWDPLGQWLHLGEEPRPAAGTEITPRVGPRPSQTHGASGFGAKVMHRVPGQWVDVCHTCRVGQDSGGQHRAHRNGWRQFSPRRARSSSSTGPPGCLATRWPAWTAMVSPTSSSGAGQDLVSTVLTPRAISEAQGWCRVIAYISPLGEASGPLRMVHSRVTAIPDRRQPSPR